MKKNNRPRFLDGRTEPPDWVYLDPYDSPDACGGTPEWSLQIDPGCLRVVRGSDWWLYADIHPMKAEPADDVVHAKVALLVGLPHAHVECIHRHRGKSHWILRARPDFLAAWKMAIRSLFHWRRRSPSARARSQTWDREIREGMTAMLQFGGGLSRGRRRASR